MGWRQMRLTKKVVESSEITSFYWTPVDGGALPIFKPGHYIGLRVDVPVDIPGGQQIRQYSLSDAPPAELAMTNGHTCIPQQHFRNSVKREEGVDDHPGLVSNVLHDIIQAGDVVEMSNPAGDFFLETASSTAQLVFISAGAGLTPLLSMLNSLTSSGSTRPIAFFHTARSKATHAFSEHIKTLTKSHTNLRYVTFHSQPAADEVQGTDYDFKGRFDLDVLDKEQGLYLSDTATQYFICGPAKFMMETATWLAKRGIDGNRVKMEVFGASDVELRAENSPNSRLLCRS